MNNQRSSSINFFVLADSHGRCIRNTLSTSSYSLITRSISGLKWVDNRDRKLSVYALLSSQIIQSSLSQANAVLFLVGTNSVRIFPARQIISQIQKVIFAVQQNYPHLNQPGKISISLTFPCFRVTRRFETTESLISNINLYNEELKLLSSQMNFNILDFHITENHLYDDMHIHSFFDDHFNKTIINHFDRVIETISMTRIATDPNPSLPPTSSSISNQVKSTKKSKSRAVLDRKNKERFEHLKLKRQQHTTKRKIHHQWTAALIKQYLDFLQVKYSRIPPVYNKILRIVFNNQHDQDLAAEQLAIHVFDENHYREFINKNH